MAVNRKNGNDVTIFYMTSSPNFFKMVLFLLSGLATGPSFMSIVTGSGFMTVSFYKGLTRNPEIGNTPSEFCPISGDWNKSGVPNLAQTFLIKSY